MKTIWKFRMPNPGDAPLSVKMPVGAEIKSLRFWAEGSSELHIWAIVDDEAPTERREFVVRPTGGLNPSDFVFIGTVFEDRYNQRDPLVWHLFEVAATK